MCLRVGRSVSAWPLTAEGTQRTIFLSHTAVLLQDKKRENRSRDAQRKKGPSKERPIQKCGTTRNDITFHVFLFFSRMHDAQSASNTTDSIQKIGGPPRHDETGKKKDKRVGHHCRNMSAVPVLQRPSAYARRSSNTIGGQRRCHTFFCSDAARQSDRPQPLPTSYSQHRMRLGRRGIVCLALCLPAAAARVRVWADARMVGRDVFAHILGVGCRNSTAAFCMAVGSAIPIRRWVPPPRQITRTRKIEHGAWVRTGNARVSYRNARTNGPGARADRRQHRWANGRSRVRAEKRTPPPAIGRPVVLHPGGEEQRVVIGVKGALPTPEGEWPGRGRGRPWRRRRRHGAWLRRNSGPG